MVMGVTAEKARRLLRRRVARSEVGGVVEKGTCERHVAGDPVLSTAAQGTRGITANFFPRAWN